MSKNKIKIIQHEEIKLDIPQFTCDDNVLGEHLNNHELTKHLNCYGLTVFIGKPQQGKTSMAISFITQSKPKIYKKTHNKVIILMPTSSIRSMKKNPFAMLPPQNFVPELNDTTIQAVYEELENNSSLGLSTLLFIDDMTADLKKTTFIENILSKIVYNRRHLKCNIIITSQSFSSISLNIRKLITNIFIFKPAKKELELLFDELIEAKKKHFLDVMKVAYKKNHDFLFVNVTSQRMFANFNEIMINDEEEESDIEK